MRKSHRSSTSTRRSTSGSADAQADRVRRTIRIVCALLATGASACNGCDERADVNANAGLHTNADADADGNPDAGANTNAGANADAGANAIWPTFPSNVKDARALTEALTSRPGWPSDPPDARALVAAFTRAIERGEVISGWTAVHSFFGAWARRAAGMHKNAWVLVGTHHDSSEQMRAFGEIVGPLAEPRFARVALEQLRADGRWIGLGSDVQLGDDAALAAWQKTGGEAALLALARAQEDSDYVAWKYGYVQDVIGVLSNARAAGETVVGCDMPASERAHLPKDLDEETTSHLRELHCARALGDSLRAAPRPRAVAMLWGDAHATPTGFARFLPREDEVLFVRVLGGRASATEPDATLEKRFVATVPVLVDRGDDVLVLLPDGPLSRHVDRARVNDGAGVTAIELSATHAVRARIGARELHVDSSPLPVPVVNGHVTLSVDLGARTILTALDIDDGTRAEVHVDDVAPEIRVVHHARSLASDGGDASAANP
jgi:hypothetical protein